MTKVCDDPETWKSYSRWYPTAHMRWRRGRLEQVWMRDYETRWGGGVVMGGNGREEEWREVPTDDEQRESK